MLGEASVRRRAECSLKADWRMKGHRNMRRAGIKGRNLPGHPLRRTGDSLVAPIARHRAPGLRADFEAQARRPDWFELTGLSGAFRARNDHF